MDGEASSHSAVSAEASKDNGTTLAQTAPAGTKGNRETQQDEAKLVKKGTLQDKGGRTLGKGPEASVTLPGCHSHSRTRVRAPLGTRLLPRLQRTLLPSRALWEGGPHREQCGWCFPKLKGQGRPKGCYGICVSRRWDRCLRTSEKSEKVILEFYVNWARLPTPTLPFTFQFLHT